MGYRRRRLVAAVIWSGALVCLGALGMAQSETPQDPVPAAQPQQPRFRVESNFVRVDAYPMKGDTPVLDLRADQFRIFEDGIAQKLETFEHVLVRPAGPQSERLDPGSQRAAEQAAANPRNRVVVIFLDTMNVSVEGAHRMNEPLIRLLDRILGPDDLVGVMTTEMSPQQIVLGRKTQVIEDSLRKNWAWGQRDTLGRDERENAYESCYPPLTTEKGSTSALAGELIRRKRERASLEALQDLVRYLRAIREERKAILTVTEGWVLYGENRDLMTLRNDPMTRWEEPVPGVDPVTVGPNGKLTTKDARRLDHNTLSKADCDADRLRLATLDNARFFLDLMEEANYANASFYPVDPRGLAVFDSPIGPDPPPSPIADRVFLTRRRDTLRTLAANTDGVAVVDTNNLDAGLRRIVDDLTSYYLLGYYSTNTKLDGRYRSLKVTVTQPGVDVRARRGYRAATAEEVAAGRAAAAAPVPDATRAMTHAIDRLGRVRADSRFAINAIAASNRTLWIAGEVMGSGPGGIDLTRGGTVAIDVTIGSTSVPTRVTLKPGERTFLTSLALPPGTAGDVGVRARLTAEGSAAPFSDTIRVTIGPSVVEPLAFRRGVTTGNQLQPAAGFRFSRTDRLRLELPVGADVTPGAGRLLDRTGQPLQLPVSISERTDPTSAQRWIVADVVLGPLADGDYGVEIALTTAGGDERVITAIRVVR